jgi:Membrane domain of glycerophosphoryl diester phosphodiesterase
MPELDLRPLSLGEILDRTFTIYRRNFLLFIGIIAIPQLMVLAFNLAQTLLKGPSSPKVLSAVSATTGVLLVIVGIAGVVIYVVAYLFAHGGTVYAVSDLYLGRPTSIGASLRRMRGQAGTLLGVSLLNGLAMLAGLILLIVPGIYVACRLITCIPAALLENLGPRESLERSFALTKDNAGRSFVIYALYLAIFYGLFLLFAFPFLFAVALSAKNPGMMKTWLALSQFGTSLATILVTPIFTIATTVFYYDLRVRKEAFDLQMMMNPNEAVAPAPTALPSMLS